MRPHARACGPSHPREGSVRRDEHDDPHVIVEVANHIYRQGATPYPHVITFLDTIDAKFPGLTFSDFLQAARLIAECRPALAQQRPWGSA